MKKILFTSAAAGVCMIMLSLFQGLQSKSNGSITGYSGAPKASGGFEPTCTNCHGGTANTGPHSVSISVNGNPSGFLPGQAYTITAKIVNPTGTRAGFSLVCLDPAKANCGSLTVGTGTRLMISATTGRTYINHSGTSLKTWTFTWTAPSSNVPDSVTFYMAGLEVTSSDNVYTGKLVFHKQAASAPVISTIQISNLTQTSATAGGNISSDGGIQVTERGVCWSTSPEPTTSLTTKTSDGSGSGIFSSNISGLSPSTLYHLRSYAINSIGTSYGEEITFTTPSCQFLGSISGNSTVTCDNPGTTLSIGNSGSSILWSTGETSSSIIVSPSATTVFYVVGSLANGCVDTAFITVNVDKTAPPVPAISPAPGTPFCAGSQFVQSSAPAGNQWTSNGTPLSGATAQNFYPMQSGTYSVTVTNPLNGCSSTAQVPVTVSVLPLPAIILQPVSQAVQPSNEVKFVTGAEGIGQTFRWQSGTGNQFTDLQAGPGIAGWDNDTLTVTPADLSWDGRQYRCIISDGTCQDTSESATLTVSFTSVRAKSENKVCLPFPNPAEGSFYFRNISSETPFAIFGITGNLLKTGQAIPGVPVSLSGFLPGTYFWELHVPEGTLRGRLITQ